MIYNRYILTICLSLMAGCGTKVLASNDAKGKLLMDVAETCVSGNHEPTDCQLMRQGAELFGIPELATLADMRENRVLDEGSKQEVTVVTALLTYAEQHYGRGSLEAINCRRRAIDIYSNINWEKTTELAKENETYAIALSKKEPKDKDVTLLKFVTRLEYLTLKNQREIENPESWEQMLKIEKEVEPYVIDSTYHTDIIVDICHYLANWKMTGLSYNDFQSYTDYLFRRVFPEGYQMHGWITNGEINNSEGYYRRALKSTKMLWGDRDVRTVFAELRLLSCIRALPSGSYESQHSRIQELQDYLTTYLPPGDLGTIDAELIKWEYDIYFNQNLYEIRSPYPMLMKIEKAYGGKNEMYLNYLHRLMNIQVSIDVERASQLAKEEEQLLNEIYVNAPDMKNVYFIGMYSLKDALGTTEHSVFQEYFTKLCDTYRQEHHSTWASIYIGRSIAEILSHFLQMFDEAADYYKIALDDINSIVGKESPLSVSCTSNYVLLLALSNDTIKKREASRMIDDVITAYSKYDICPADIYQTKSELAFGLGEYDRGIQSLRDGIATCKKPADSMWRCILQLELANYLELDKNSFTLTPEATALYEEAIPFFNKNKEIISGYYMKCYEYLSDYYLINKQFKEAEDILLEGMQHCESISGEFDYIYMGIVGKLFDLYANQLINMDKAEEIIELCKKNAEIRPSISNNRAILELLWNKYYLLVKKQVDFVLQISALNDIFVIVKKIAVLARDNVEQIRPLGDEVLYALGDQFATIGLLERQINEQLEFMPEDDKLKAKEKIAFFQHTKETISSDFFPYMQEKVNNLINTGIKEDDPRLGNPYRFLANYYIYLVNDTINGENCYKKLLNIKSERSQALRSLAGISFSRGQNAQALVYLKELIEQPGYYDYASIQTKSYDIQGLLIGYNASGQFEEALRLARELYQYQQQLIALNFDHLTQTEREAFVNSGGGAGSYWLCALLNKYPDELKSETFNAVLSEKGLQLRASERIKRAIMKSGNNTLIAMQDTLNQLTAQYKTMNSTYYDWDNWEVKNEMLVLRQKIESLERSINRQAAQFIEGMDTPDWKKLQSVLKPGEAAVEYVFSDSIVGVLVLLPKGEPQYIQMASASVLWKGLDIVKDFEVKRRSEALYEEDRLHLFERLWQPMESLMKDVRTVYYSPSGFLNDLAFAAFKCPDGTYLSDHYELHQMLSTGDLVSLREEPAANLVKTAMLFGSVYYSPEQELLARQIAQGTGNRGQASEQRGAILDDGEAFGYLSFTKEEVEHVDHILKNKGITVQRLTGFSPTEETLHAVSEKSPEVLHLSTHGFFVRGDKEAKVNKFLSRFPSMQFSSMQRSGLALVGANRTWEGATDKPEEADGIITANEVALLDLSHTRLAVLSACQTAVGEYSTEGVYGMHRGFKQAGVKSILASLWNVNDKSTARLMELFYGKWLSGTPMQQSLIEAVRELRKEYSSPFYWAPFVLMDAEN